jgi:type IV pilus assembly protein PilB
MSVTEEIREMILKSSSAAEIKREASRLGMTTLRQSALAKLMEGAITFEEVVRVTMADV